MHMSHVILNECLYPFIARIFNIRGSGVLTDRSALWLLYGWCHVKCCSLGASSVYIIQPCTSLQCHFIQSHIGRVYVWLAITCHLHFWQNDRYLLRATAVTREWNGYRNQSQHRKSTLEKKILLPLLPGFEPATFRSSESGAHFNSDSEEEELFCQPAPVRLGVAPVQPPAPNPPAPVLPPWFKQFY